MRLNERWDEIARLVPASMTEDQLAQMRNAFYAGALAALQDCLGSDSLKSAAGRMIAECEHYVRPSFEPKGSP